LTMCRDEDPVNAQHVKRIADSGPPHGSGSKKGAGKPETYVGVVLAQGGRLLRPEKGERNRVADFRT
jgi:hypothetical protein